MISVKAPAAPPTLLTAWAAEKQRALRLFAAGIPKAKFKFAAYATVGVKDALEAAFYGKCAYCESQYRAVSPGDIEHYRPKTYIDLGGKQRAVGYYWLAGEIENLLPSCRNCNTPTWQDIVARADKEKVGKGNLFPLADEARRAAREGDEVREYPLLLNPYRDDPDEYLEFAATGGVTPVPSLRGRKKRRAETTIRVYGLSRLALVELRASYAKRVRGQLEHLLEAYENWKRAPGAAARKKQVVREWLDLQRLLASDQPYLAMSRRLIQRQLRKTQLKEITRLAAPASQPARSRAAGTARTRKSAGRAGRKGRQSSAPRGSKSKRP